MPLETMRQARMREVRRRAAGRIECVRSQSVERCGCARSADRASARVATGAARTGVDVAVGNQGEKIGAEAATLRRDASLYVLAKSPGRTTGLISVDTKN